MGKKREAKEGAVEEDSGRGQSKGGKFGSGKGKLGLAKRGGKPAGRVKSELKSAEQIRRDRALAEKKRAKQEEEARQVAELSVYSATDNPFHDANLGQQFKWHKKSEKEYKLTIIPR